MTTKPQPKGDPILIPCEGSGARGHLASCDDAGTHVAMCSMCGRYFAADHLGVVVAHSRDDVLARLERGDFG